MLTKSTKNPKKLLIFYTNADNMINKRNEIQSLVSTNNPDVFCITETLPKNVLLKIEECEIQIDGYDCFSNINNSNCHRGVAIYTKRYLNARSYLTNVKDFQEHACRKIELSDKTSLHILCLYRSPNSTSENNKLLNQLILNTSLIGGKLLIPGDFNFPTINWDSLSTPHLSNHCASEFLAATQDAFLFQYVQSPAHNRPNQKPTLIDLIVLQDDQTITNMTTSAPRHHKIHHKVLRFHYTVDNNSKNERPHYLYHRTNYDSMKLELQRVDWYEVFYNSSSTEYWGKIKEIINNLISKFVLLQKYTPRKKTNLYG